MKFSKKQIGAFLVLVLFLSLQSVFAASQPIEQTMSTRQSTRDYTSQAITEPQLLEILRAAYGTWQNHRSVPKIGTDYSLTVFAVNATGSYRFVPEDNLLVVHDLTVNKDTISPIDFQGYASKADTVLIPVWNQTTMDNLLFASAEVGCFAQNVYLAAANLGIGTVSEGGIRPTQLRDALNLASTMTPMLLMPLGYPTSPYPSASPDYTRMNGNLPLVQNSSLSLADTLNNMLFTQAWSSQALSAQELSQLLWAGYGYSNTTHRTTPSAYDIYPLKILVLNATGVYQYTPENHSVTEILTGDKRLDLTNALGNQTWAANAPALFLIGFDSTLGGEGDSYDHIYMNINAGAVVQNILLEASAWNLAGNTLNNGLEKWNDTGAQEIRNILHLPSTLIPMYSLPIGHRAGYDLNIRVRDWDLTDNIQGALVYKDSDSKTTDANGWANWTDAAGTAAIKVNWFGEWINGTFSITMDGDKTIDVRCNIFDVYLTCVEENHHANLQNVNATAFAGGSKVTSGITDAHGSTHLVNVPNGTLTFIAYDGNNNVIANTTRTIASEDQFETLICNENYANLQINWQITEVWISGTLIAPILLLTVIFGLPSSMRRLKRRMKMLRLRNKDNKYMNC
jgi:hypothetical protein